jgi:hypothetical protein
LKQVWIIKYDLETTNYKLNTSEQPKIINLTSHFGTKKNVKFDLSCFIRPDKRKPKKDQYYKTAFLYSSGSQTFFHLRTPWQPKSINCTVHVSKMSVITIVAVISNLYVELCAFLRHYSIFVRTHKCPGSYTCGYAYPRLGINAVFYSALRSLLKPAIPTHSGLSVSTARLPLSS